MTTENKRVDASVSVKTLGVVKNFGVTPAKKPVQPVLTTPQAKQPHTDTSK